MCHGAGKLLKALWLPRMVTGYQAMLQDLASRSTKSGPRNIRSNKKSCIRSRFARRTTQSLIGDSAGTNLWVIFICTGYCSESRRCLGRGPSALHCFRLDLTWDVSIRTGHQHSSGRGIPWRRRDRTDTGGADRRNRSFRRRRSHDGKYCVDQHHGRTSRQHVDSNDCVSPDGGGIRFGQMV